jgi:ribosomal protein S18 acetylase RimI-like enzyme
VQVSVVFGTMARFQPYAPAVDAQPPLPITIRRAVPEDALAIATLDAERSGGEASALVDAVGGALAAGHDKVWVAEHAGEVCGYGKLVWRDMGVHGLPTGWHLMGLVVAPHARRQGVGTRLARVRLEWVAEQGGTEVCSTVAEANRASAALHRSLGFERVGRDVNFPLGDAEAGPSARFRLDLSPALPLRLGGDLPGDDLVALYTAVGWTAYTDDVDMLAAAVRGSTFVASRWSGDRLVALCRVVSDDASMAYLQDILVHPEQQRSGLGRSLVQLALDRFAHVRQLVLLTDDRPNQHAFYAALGLRDTRNTPLHTFVRIRGL